MPNLFSQDLILRLQKYVKGHFGQDITTEQAVVFLSSLADLYMAVGGRG